MNDCISRAALLAFEKMDAAVIAPEVHSADDILLMIKTAPPVQPDVPHGKWEHLGGDEWCCTVCGYVISTEGSWEKPTAKFCEECGARMDGDADE